MFSSSTLVSLLVLAVSALAHNDTANGTNPDVSTLAVGGFAQSCSGWGGIYNTDKPDHGAAILYATCRNRSGKDVFASIDLNGCIANYGGNLACARNGGAFNSCQLKNALKTGNTVLYAICTDGRGGYTRPGIDVNTCVGNLDGVLAC